MATGSIFDFLSNKKELNEVYLQCIAMEKEISAEIYSNAIVTGRTIAEMIIKIISKTDKNLSKKFFKVKNGREPKPKLWKLKEACYKNKLISTEIYRMIDDIEKTGNDSHHSSILSKYTLDHAKEIHKKVFLICLDMYNNYFDYERVDYEFDLNYLNEEAIFTHEELMDHLNNIQENTVPIYDLIAYIEEKGMFLPINSFKKIMINYIDDVIDEDEYNDTIDSIKFIDYDILERIIDNINNSVSENLADTINKLNTENLKNVVDELRIINESYIDLNEINLLIENNNDKQDIYYLIKLIMSDYIIAKYNEIIQGLKSVKVSKLDKNNRIIVESPYLKIKEDNDKISIIEDDNKIILNEDQKKAVEYYDKDKKSLVIDAGPGSGKTRVIIERVVYLIKELNQHPSTILVITFTRKATEELRERFKNDTELTINQINQMRISTIHSFCRHIISKCSKGEGPYNFLMRNGERGLFIQDNKENLGFVRDSFIYESNVSDITESYNDYFNFKLIYDKLEEYITNKYTIKSSYYKFINEYYKDKPDYAVPPWNLIKSGGFGRDWHFSQHHAVAKSYEKYKELLDYRKVCDNNYLLEKANEILEDTSILNGIKFTNILIDEFQDTDHVQKELFDKLLVKKDLNTFTVVGDADQSIYGWRGAYPDLFKKYVSDDEGYNFKKITLHTNYRSSRAIVEFNEEFIKDHRQIPKKLVSDKGYNLPVYYMPNSNSEEEATNIVSIINTLKDNKKIENYGDIAILFRSNNDVNKIIEPLEKADIKYYLKDKKDFLEQSEVKAILTLFWYLMPYKKDHYILRSEDFLNLHGFTNERYKSSHIFKLSPETMNILDNIQKDYDEAFLSLGLKKIPKNQYKFKNYKTNSITRTNLYREIFYSLPPKELKDLFSRIDSRDLAEFDEIHLRKLGITNDHDLNFFKKLNELKAVIHNPNIKKYEKPTTIDVFYELITIIDFYEDINIQKNKEAKKIKSNLALISEIIYDFESIVGKYRYERLFRFLNGVLSQYSCPIHDLEDNLDKVHIMTVHKAKGLEYPVVILGSLKHELKINDSEGKYETPFDCLEHKPDTKREEEENRLEEEYRILYVAMTRAEELLILSSVHRRQLPPKFISEIVDKNFNRIRKIEPYAYNLASIPKINSSKKSEKTNIFPELSFENIINDYLFCPTYYDIFDNTKFKNRYNDDFFTDQRMQEVLEEIFNTKEISDDEIEKVNEDIKDSFMIKEGDETSKVLNRIPEFWNKYGKYYTPLENVEMGLIVAYIMDNCDLHGKIDLIVKEDDENINIVKFIPSNYKISKYIDFYKYMLSFYPLMAKNNEYLKKYNIKNIILHSIKENERYIVPFDDGVEEEIAKELHNSVNKIINEDFEKHRNNCNRCPYKDTICKG